MNINFKKTKEMIVGPLSKTSPPLLVIDNNVIQRVTSFKLLGVQLDCNLKWQNHVDNIYSRAASRLYFLKQLRRSNVNSDDAFIFYTSVIRPVLEYACPAWHSSLTKEQAHRLENIQKRALFIIYGSIDYLNFCNDHTIPTLYERRELLTRKFFKDILNNDNNCLRYLLPNARCNELIVKLRHPTTYIAPKACTNRFKNSFLLYALDNYQQP
jgi:hypothetical protein